MVPENTGAALTEHHPAPGHFWPNRCNEGGAARSYHARHRLFSQRDICRGKMAEPRQLVKVYS